jgi:anti-anti-sigma factor
MEPFFSEQQNGPVTLIEFKTESLMSGSDLERISARLTDIVDEQHPPKVVLDFKKVRYLSSQAIGMLIGLKKRCDAGKGTLALNGVGPSLMQLLKLTNLHRMFTITPL